MPIGFESNIEGKLGASFALTLIFSATIPPFSHAAKYASVNPRRRPIIITRHHLTLRPLLQLALLLALLPAQALVLLPGRHAAVGGGAAGHHTVGCFAPATPSSVLRWLLKLVPSQ